MSKWLMDGRVFDYAPDEFLGFVYLVTHRTTKRKYIGQKAFWKKVRRKPLKGRKRPRLEQVESDWQRYNTSCKEIQEQVKAAGEAAFKWEILGLAKTKAWLNYMETEELFAREVLFNPNYYNGIINVRVAANQLGFK